VIRMTTQNVPAFQIEDHMPPPNELKFRVDFIYHDEIPEQDLDKYWKRFGKKQVIKSKVLWASGKPWNSRGADCFSERFAGR